MGRLAQLSFKDMNGCDEPKDRADEEYDGGTTDELRRAMPREALKR
jgi:hypothetical protein